MDMDDGGRYLLDVINDPLLFQSFFEGREDGDGLSANVIEQHLESLTNGSSSQGSHGLGSTNNSALRPPSNQIANGGTPNTQENLSKPNLNFNRLEDHLGHVNLHQATNGAQTTSQINLDQINLRLDSGAPGLDALQQQLLSNNAYSGGLSKEFGDVPNDLLNSQLSAGHLQSSSNLPSNVPSAAGSSSVVSPLQASSIPSSTQPGASIDCASPQAGTVPRNATSVLPQRTYSPAGQVASPILQGSLGGASPAPPPSPAALQSQRANTACSPLINIGQTAQSNQISNIIINQRAVTPSQSSTPTGLASQTTSNPATPAAQNDGVITPSPSPHLQLQLQPQQLPQLTPKQQQQGVVHTNQPQTQQLVPQVSQAHIQLASQATTTTSGSAGPQIIFGTQPGIIQGPSGTILLNQSMLNQSGASGQQPLLFQSVNGQLQLIRPPQMISQAPNTANGVPPRLMLHTQPRPNFVIAPKIIQGIPGGLSFQLQQQPQILLQPSTVLGGAPTFVQIGTPGTPPLMATPTPPLATTPTPATTPSPAPSKPPTPTGHKDQGAKNNNNNTNQMNNNNNNNDHQPKPAARPSVNLGDLLKEHGILDASPPPSPPPPPEPEPTPLPEPPKKSALFERLSQPVPTSSSTTTTVGVLHLNGNVVPVVLPSQVSGQASNMTNIRQPGQPQIVVSKDQSTHQPSPSTISSNSFNTIQSTVIQPAVANSAPRMVYVTNSNQLSNGGKVISNISGQSIAPGQVVIRQGVPERAQTKSPVDNKLYDRLKTTVTELSVLPNPTMEQRLLLQQMIGIQETMKERTNQQSAPQPQQLLVSQQPGRVIMSGPVNGMQPHIITIQPQQLQQLQQNNQQQIRSQPHLRSIAPAPMQMTGGTKLQLAKGSTALDPSQLLLANGSTLLNGQALLGGMPQGVVVVQAPQQVVTSSSSTTSNGSVQVTTVVSATNPHSGTPTFVNALSNSTNTVGVPTEPTKPAGAPLILSGLNANQQVFKKVMLSNVNGIPTMVQFGPNQIGQFSQTPNGIVHFVSQAPTAPTSAPIYSTNVPKNVPIVKSVTSLLNNNRASSSSETSTVTTTNNQTPVFETKPRINRTLIKTEVCEPPVVTQPSQASPSACRLSSSTMKVSPDPPKQSIPIVTSTNIPQSPSTTAAEKTSTVKPTATTTSNTHHTSMISATPTSSTLTASSTPTTTTVTTEFARGVVSSRQPIKVQVPVNVPLTNVINTSTSSPVNKKQPPPKKVAPIQDKTDNKTITLVKCEVVSPPSAVVTIKQDAKMNGGLELIQAPSTPSTKTTVVTTTPQLSRSAKRKQAAKERERLAAEKAKRARFDQRSNNDQKDVLNPSLKPFQNLEDAIKRLLPYHLCDVSGPTEFDLQESDARFDSVAERLTQVQNHLVSRFQVAQLKIGAIESPHSEMMLVSKLLLEDEKSLYQERKGYAITMDVSSTGAAEQSNTEAHNDHEDNCTTTNMVNITTKTPTVAAQSMATNQNSHTKVHAPESLDLDEGVSSHSIGQLGGDLGDASSQSLSDLVPDGQLTLSNLAPSDDPDLANAVNSILFT